MNIEPLRFWPIMAATACAIPSAAMVDRASAASYFCSPAPIKLGTYRPEADAQELDISVRFEDASPFWFDDRTGDYLAFANGKIGDLEAARVRVPPELALGSDELSNLVAGTYAAGQCVATDMGVVPSAQGANP